MKKRQFIIEPFMNALLLFTFGMIGLTTLEAQIVPGWVNELERVFPSRDWIAVVGQGTSQPQAESAAMNALARDILQSGMANWGN